MSIKLDFNIIRKKQRELIKLFRSEIEKKGIKFVNRNQESNSLTKLSNHLVEASIKESESEEEFENKFEIAKNEIIQVANRMVAWLRKKGEDRIRKIGWIKKIQKILCDEDNGGFEFLCD